MSLKAANDITVLISSIAPSARIESQRLYRSGLVRAPIVSANIWQADGLPVFTRRVEARDDVSARATHESGHWENGNGRWSTSVRVSANWNGTFDDARIINGPALTMGAISSCALAGGLKFDTFERFFWKMVSERWTRERRCGLRANRYY